MLCVWRMQCSLVVLENSLCNVRAANQPVDNLRSAEAAASAESGARMAPLTAKAGPGGAWNNAGISDVSRPFTELSRTEWDRMIAVNLTSVFLCMKHELRQMTVQGYGAIVNTSSGAGLVAAPFLPHYTAAKHGVLGLTKAAAQEFNGAGIRVNAVCPGMVDTPMIQSWFESSPGIAQAVLATMPGGRLGRPEQVAEAAVWLCGDPANWVSGLSMVVDGGAVNR